MKELIIGLGSNLGDRRANLLEAIDLVGKNIGVVTAISSFVETDPWGFESENKFLNAAIIVLVDNTSANQGLLGGSGIIRILQKIESGFGRVKTGIYTDRPIDLDILFYGDDVILETGLIVPHPKLHDRDFVLIPLMEICPDKVHPITGKSIRRIYEEFCQQTGT